MGIKFKPYDDLEKTLDATSWVNYMGCLYGIVKLPSPSFRKSLGYNYDVYHIPTGYRLFCTVSKSRKSVLRQLKQLEHDIGESIGTFLNENVVTGKLKLINGVSF